MEGLAGIDRRPTRVAGPTVEQARAFCAVADAASYRMAADLLQCGEHLPVIRLVSRFTKAIDRGQLVVATSRGDVTLTSVGRQVLPVAQRFVESAEALREIRPEIRFSAYPTIAGRVAAALPDLLDAPIPLVMHNIGEDSRENGGRELVDDVLSGELDLAVAPSGHGCPGLEEHHLYSWRLRVVVPDDDTHPLARRRRALPEDLAEHRIAASPLGHTSRNLLQHAFSLHHVRLNVALESPNHELLRAVARGGRGYVAVIPDDAFDAPDVRRGPCVATRDGNRLGGDYALYLRSPDRKSGPDRLTEHQTAVANAALALRAVLGQRRR